MTDEKYDIIGYPKLVRLNPNVPWKTRGNGAVSLQIGTGKGKKVKIGGFIKKMTSGDSFLRMLYVLFA